MLARIVTACRENIVDTQGCSVLNKRFIFWTGLTRFPGFFLVFILFIL